MGSNANNSPTGATNADGATASGGANGVPDQRHCESCKKTDGSLKHCAKCSVTLYCSRDCQKKDWKTHKKICGKQPDSAQQSSGGGRPESTSTSTGLTPPKGLDQPIADPFTQLVNGTYLHSRPEKDVYRILIDAYRLRLEDDYTMTGDVATDSIYGGAASGINGFIRFLREAATRPGLLPPWWVGKDGAAVQLSADEEWYDLGRCVEKSDIIEHYGDPRFPMQLRMVAEAVLKKGPGGQSGAMRMNMMAGMEGGGPARDMMSGMSSQLLDVSAAMR